jgi:hypothetical protein
VNILLLQEAIHSVALSHPEGHECDVCKAAAGDLDAFGRIAIKAFIEGPEPK